MNHGTDRREPGELESLYDTGAGVEPDRSLDRQILARAEKTVARPAMKRPARWLGGLATAAALVLVVVVVVDPGPGAPDGLPAEYPAPSPVAEPAPPAGRDAALLSAPNAPARFGERAESGRQSLRSRQEQAVAPAMTDEFSDSAGLARNAEAELMTEATDAELREQAGTMDDASVLAWIARLIEQEELDQAAVLLRLLEARQIEAEEP